MLENYPNWEQASPGDPIEMAAKAAAIAWKLAQSSLIARGLHRDEVDDLTDAALHYALNGGKFQESYLLWSRGASEGVWGQAVRAVGYAVEARYASVTAYEDRYSNYGPLLCAAKAWRCAINAAHYATHDGSSGVVEAIEELNTLRMVTGEFTGGSEAFSLGSVLDKVSIGQ